MSNSTDSLAFFRALIGHAAAPSGAPTVLGERWSFLGTLEPGRTVLGHDRVLDVPVRLLPLPPNDAAARERARQLLRLVHPHVVRVLTLQHHGNVEVLVLDALDGQTLAELAESPSGVPAARVAALGIELLDGLAWAHAHGVVHGALDAEAVLVVRDGRVVVDGFGLATPTGGTADDVRAAARVLTELLTSASPDTGTSPSPVLRVLRQLATGEIGDAQAGREALSRARRLGMEVHTGGRPVRPPPWADPARTAPARARTEPEPLAVGGEDETTAVMLVDDARAEAEAPPQIVLPAPATAPPAPPTTVEAPKPAVVAAPPVAAAPATRRGRPPAGMVWVTGPAGDFLIDADPVTNAQYKLYLDATGATPPAHWLGTRVPQGKEQHPVVGVSLGDARAFAAWRGVRLPTEGEWLAAAGAPQGRAFPWGATACGAAHCSCVKLGAEGTSAIDAHPASATPEGVRDLLGNVWEWVEGGGVDPTRTPVLGGSFKHPCKVPGQAPRTELAPTSSYLYVGFRCAADGAAAP